MSTIVAPDSKSEQYERDALQSPERDPADRTREWPKAHFVDPTQGRKIGSDLYDDPTQGRKIGSHPHDDPTRAR